MGGIGLRIAVGKPFFVSQGGFRVQATAARQVGNPVS